MVVDQINVAGVTLLEPEDHPPVRAESHAPEAFQAASERVEPETGKIHVFGLSGSVENGEDILRLLDVIGPDAFGFAILEKPFQPLVPKALNHTTSLW
jgi:hypothetical protein